MRLAISTRLFVALTAVSLLVLSLNAAVTRYNFERGFFDYVARQEMATITALADELAAVYEQDPSWRSISNDPRRFHDLMRESSEPGLPRPPAGPRDRPRDKSGDRPGDRPGGPAGRPPGGPPPEDPLGFSRRISVVAADGRVVAGNQTISTDATSTPIVVNGAAVAHVLIAPPKELTDRLDRDFFRQQERSMIIAGVGALLLAALMSALLARQLTRPIRSLASGARSISGGAYDTRIEAQRDDELGDLANEFNRLARTLERNRESRRRWVSDIAHELRTPLAVLRGELDALEDGVRSFDDKTRRSLAAEVGRLTSLVSELHDLSQYDEGEVRYDISLLDVAGMLRDLIAASSPRLELAGIEVDASIADDSVLVAADADKLERVFLNLVENTLRYTDAPGRLRVNLSASADTVLIEFSDSSPGVPRRSLPKLFDRLYRVEDSRSRATGGSGLGLAICKAIVEAHDGRIDAAKSPLGGLAIRIELPLADTGHTAR